MSREPLTVRELARRLIDREVASGDGPEHAARAAQVACERACHELGRSLGTTGTHTLLVRAVAQAEVAHPFLKDLRTNRDADQCLTGLAEIIEKHGAPAAASALEGILEAMLDLLGRLIGNDMVPRLLEHSASIRTHDDEDVR